MEPSIQKPVGLTGFEPPARDFKTIDHRLSLLPEPPSGNSDKALNQDKKGRIRLELNRLPSRINLQTLFQDGAFQQSERSVAPATARARYIYTSQHQEKSVSSSSDISVPKSKRPRSKSFGEVSPVAHMLQADEMKPESLSKKIQVSRLRSESSSSDDIFSEKPLKLETGFFNRKKASFNDAMKKTLRETTERFTSGLSFEDFRSKIKSLCKASLNEMALVEQPLQESLNGHKLNSKHSSGLPALSAINRAISIAATFDSSLSLMMQVQENLKILLNELEDLFENSKFVATHRALKLKTFLNQLTTWDDLDNSISEFARFFKEKLSELDEKERAFVLKAVCSEESNARMLLKILEDWNLGFKNIKNIALELLTLYYPTQEISWCCEKSDKNHPANISLGDLKRAFMPEDKALFKEIIVNGKSLPLQFNTADPILSQKLFYTHLFAELIQTGLFGDSSALRGDEAAAHFLSADHNSKINEEGIIQLLNLLKCGTINAWKQAHDLFLSLFPALNDRSQIWSKCEQGIRCHITASGEQLSLTQIKKYGIYDAKIFNYAKEECLVEFELAWTLHVLKDGSVKGVLTLPDVTIHESPKLSKQYVIYKTFGLTTEAIDHAINQTTSFERVERNDKKH